MSLSLNPRAAGGQEPGDQRRLGGDGPAAPGPSGGPFGLSGDERLAVGGGWLVGMAIVSLITFLDIVTIAHAPVQRGFVRALVLEGSSWLTMMASLLVPAAVAIWLRRRRPPLWLAALVETCGLAVYFTVHVGGFVVLRKLAYPLVLGHAYETDPLLGGILYEGSKDVPAYAFGVAAFWLALRWLAARAPSAADAAWFDIRDGARLLRVPTSDILAVRSAGNYVEFLLGDGRSPLMRAALSAVEPKLAAHGFVRTHRSWLVNSTRMSGLRPDGSGDYTVELGGLEAPLSRRFPQALAKLRG